MYSIRETKVCIVSRCHLDIVAQHGVDCLRGYGANSVYVHVTTKVIV